MWNKAYEKLFGGFEDLTANANDDDNEEDELAAVSKSKKTKQGYLKDGFVVDGSNDSCSGSEEDTEGVDGEEEDTEYETESDSESDNSKLYVEDVGSELSEEEYEYDNKPMTK